MGRDLSLFFFIINNLNLKFFVGHSYVLDSDFKFFDLNLEMRYFFLGLIDFGYIFLKFLLKLLFLILDTFNFLIFETIFHFVDAICSDLFFFFELLKLFFNILKFLCEISFLDV